MKLKARGALRQGGVCIADPCDQKQEAFGFCRKHREALNASLEKGRAMYLRRPIDAEEDA